jgi:gliding motility-associated-like protein
VYIIGQTARRAYIGLPASGTGDIPSFTAVNNGNNAVTATITATPTAAGFAYITDESSNDVTVINTLTHSVITTIAVGTEPWGVSVSPDGTRVYVANNNNINGGYPGIGTVSVISALTNTVISTITVGSAPYGVVISPDGSLVYVTNTNGGTVSVIDTKTNSVVSNISISTPTGITISPDEKWLYVTSAWGANLLLYVINTTTNSVVSTIPINSYSSGLTISRDGTRLYLTLNDANEVMVINTATNAVITTIPVGTEPVGVSILPDGSKLYVTNLASKSVSIINTATNTVISTLPTSGNPYGLSVTPDGKDVYVANNYVANQNSGNVSVINTTTNNISTINAGMNPIALGNFISAGPGCNSSPVTFTITVNPTLVSPPSITFGTVTGNISSCAGTPSASPNIQQFTVSGSNLTGDITATAPPGFELSLSAGSGYGNSVILTRTGGTVNNIVLYVRSAASATGSISGNAVLSSAGAASQNVAVNGVVNALPTVNPVISQTVNTGQNTAAINFTGTGNTFTWTNDIPGIGLPASGTGSIASFTTINTGTMPVIATVTAISTNTDGFIYTANSGDGTVSVINVNTNSVVATITVGSKPVSVAVSADGKRVYVANFNSNTISVIDPATNTLISTITQINSPFCVKVSPDGSLIYVSNYNSNTVSVISTSTYSIVAQINVGVNPSNLCVSPDGKNVYVIDYSGAFEMIDTQTNTITNNFGSAGPLRDITISPDGSQIYASNSGYNFVWDINSSNVKPITTIYFLGTPYGVTNSPDGKNVYTSINNLGLVYELNFATNSITAQIAVGTNPQSLFTSQNGNFVYVANEGSNDISVIYTITNKVITTIPVGSNPNSISGFIPITTCPGSPITFTIEVNPTLPASISASGTLSALKTIYGTASASTSFNISGSNMTTGILVTPSPGFEVSTDNVAFSTMVMIGATGTIAPTPVYIRLASNTPVGNYTGNIVLSSATATNVNTAVPVSIVNPAPLSITVNNVNKTYGTALTGAPTSIGFISTGLQNNETVGSITVTYGSGSAANAKASVYASSVTASAATGGTFTAGNYAITYLPGDITVGTAKLTIAADDKTKSYGTTNPVLTITFSGFVNNEGPMQLDTQPLINTTATTTSPVGQYPITTSGAASLNYTFTYLPGILTINPILQIIVVPNTFTPNGDGINDVWTIKALIGYPKCTVDVYTRYGSMVYQSKGYPKPWDGMFNGTLLPVGTYYYIINPQNGTQALSGSVTILR